MILYWLILGSAQGPMEPKPCRPRQLSWKTHPPGTCPHPSVPVLRFYHLFLSIWWEKNTWKHNLWSLSKISTKVVFALIQLLFAHMRKNFIFGFLCWSGSKKSFFPSARDPEDLSSGLHLNVFPRKIFFHHQKMWKFSKIMGDKSANTVPALARIWPAEGCNLGPLRLAPRHDLQSCAK